ncbi:MAG TPA: glycosyltransferase family 9 protein [Methylotenera sp.]|nr:glycosyltransferase family 9 protein [Methylotenera sp.]
MNYKARIALVSFDSLGDGLIYLMMAENLRINGYAVTYYGGIANQIKHWMPNLTIKAYPQPNMLDQELMQYDLVIMSPPTFLRGQMTDEFTKKMREKWVLICQKCPSNWYYDHTERLKTGLPSNIFDQIQRLSDCSGSIRFKQFHQESVVEMTLRYMEEKMHLPLVTKSVELMPPLQLQHRRFRERIIISPDSAGPEDKNWSAKSFLRLCHQLKAKGYDPKIVVAPQHHQAWKEMKGNIYETPIFHDINGLTSYIYESGGLIANDSGNGHLASFLNVPVVTIYRKRNKNFHWRPSWGAGKVVCPLITPRWYGGKIWKPFIYTPSIIKSLEEIL